MNDKDEDGIFNEDGDVFIAPKRPSISKFGKEGSKEA